VCVTDISCSAVHAHAADGLRLQVVGAAESIDRTVDRLDLY